MTETIPGGCYLAADNKTYVDANGEPVSAENVAKFLELQKRYAGQMAAQEAQLAQQNLNASQVLTALMGMQPTPTLVFEPEDTATGGVTSAATAKVDAKAKK